LRNTVATIITLLWTDGSLTSNSVVTGETVAVSSLTIASAFVRAFDVWMHIISTNSYCTHPRQGFGAYAQGTVRTGPLCFSTGTHVTHTVRVYHAFAMEGAIIFAKTTMSVAAPVIHNFIDFLHICRRTSWVIGWLSGRLCSRLHRGL
jgi:hypothetical protein